MDQLQRLLVETKLFELEVERQQDALIARAESLGLDKRRRVRSMLGAWLVRLGLWLDPRADERVAPQPEQRNLAQRLQEATERTETAPVVGG